VALGFDGMAARDGGIESETLSLIEGAGKEKYSARSHRAAQVRAEMEAAGEAANLGSGEALLLSLIFQSSFMTTVGVILAMRAESTAVLTEVVSTVGDLLAYLASLFTVWYVRGRDMEFRDKMELRTAIFSTVLLGVAAIKIATIIFFQLRCAHDNEYHFHHIPCAYLQARPNPNLMVNYELFCAASYIPVVVVAMKYTRMDYYSPEANISHASAVLHAIVDATSIVILLVSAALMTVWTSDSVIIDAVASFVVLVVIGVSSALMWKRYYQSMEPGAKSPKGSDQEAA
jgi:Co/Zn/Cd efflux system component